MDCLWQGLELKVIYVALSDWPAPSVNVNLLTTTLCLKILRETGNFRLLLQLYRTPTHFYWRETKALRLHHSEDATCNEWFSHTLLDCSARSEQIDLTKRKRPGGAKSRAASVRKTTSYSNSKVSRDKAYRQGISLPLRSQLRKPRAQETGERSQGHYGGGTLPWPPAAIHYETPR